MSMAASAGVLAVAAMFSYQNMPQESYRITAEDTTPFFQVNEQI
jgi:Tfp pilus assembly protein PilE